MSVTTILFKKGATVPTGSNFAATVGEPLWYTGGNQLYVTNGTNTPTLIGPIQQVQADWTQSDSTAVDFIKNKPAITAPVQSNWNESDSTSLAYILNKPTIPDAVSYVAVGTTSSGTHTIGTLTIGATSYSLTCPVPTISGTNDGTNWTTITIGNETHSIPSGGGQTTGRDDELTAVAASAQVGAETANLKTLQGTKCVTLRHDPVGQNNEGSMATFTVSNIEDGGTDTGNRIVTMKITVIDGGSW